MKAPGWRVSQIVNIVQILGLCSHVPAFWQGEHANGPTWSHWAAQRVQGCLSGWTVSDVHHSLALGLIASEVIIHCPCKFSRMDGHGADAQHEEEVDYDFEDQDEDAAEGGDDGNDLCAVKDEAFP